MDAKWMPINPDMEVTVVDPASGERAPAVPTEANSGPGAAELGQWGSSARTLNRKTALELGFVVGSVSGEMTQRVVVSDFSRSTERLGSDGLRRRWGVAVRLVVSVSTADADGGLTLPIIAAKAQTQNAQADFEITVHGFVGDDLGPLIPVSATFDVDAYVKVMEALPKIRDHIFSNPDGIAPEVLQVLSLPIDGAPSPDEAIGGVLGLRGISEGRSLDETLERLASGERDTHEGVVRATYEAILGGSEDAQPGERLQYEWQDRLRPLFD